MFRSTCLVALALSLCAVTFAQERHRPVKPPISTAQSIEIITRTIQDCEKSSDKFVRTLRRALGSSALSGTAREDELNKATKDLERSMDRVVKAWTKKKDISETRRHVRDAIDSARNVDFTMRRRRLDPNVERDWREVRAQLNLLAHAFKLPSISW